MTENVARSSQKPLRQFFITGLRRLDSGYLVVIAVCLLAIWPFLSRSALPLQTDAELHIFRLAELSRLIRAGELFPRWAPNFYFGYGYPIFNYYAPLTYYLALPVDLMPLLGPVEAVKAVFVLGLLVAGLGMYGFVRDNWGRLAGLLASTVYVYSPYLLFIDPHARGDLAEAFSFAVFPLCLWAMDRLRRRPGAWNWLASAFLVAALILTHNLMALVFFTILLAWALWQVVTSGLRTVPVRELAPTIFKAALPLRLILALLSGLGLAAFFWLPVLLEQDAVNLSSLVGDGGHFDFRNHFLSLPELLALPLFSDWGATQPAYNLSLGPVQWLLGLLGLAALVAGRVKRSAHATFFAIALLVLVVLMLPVSAWLWDMVPGLPFLQFPWRLLGASAAMLAVLSGVGVSALPKLVSPRASRWMLLAAIALTLLLALPLLQIPPWPDDFGPTTAARVLQEELAGRWLGTTSTADFVPATVDIIPGPERALVQDLLVGKPGDRVNRATLPENTEVSGEQITPLHLRFHVNSSVDFPLRLFLFDFPGWQVTIDGRTAATELGRPEGFIVVPVPAGEHQVDVEFRNTGARRLALAVSAVAALLTLLFAWRLHRWTRRPVENRPTPDHFSEVTFWMVAGLGLLILAAQALLIEPAGWLRHNSEGLTVIPADNSLEVDFGDQVTLLGYDLNSNSAAPGEEVALTLYWKAQQPLDINYQVFVHLLDGTGRVLAQSDKLNPGDYPTRRWPLDQYVRDIHQLQLPAGMPAGEYTLAVGLWVASDGWRLPIVDDQGNQRGDNFPLTDRLVVK